MSHNRYAYLVGANGPNTQKVNPLKYAEQDAMRLAKAFKGGYCDFTLAEYLVAEKRDKTLAELEQFAQKCEPSDLLIVHFSGHAIYYYEELYLLCNSTDIEKNLEASAIDISAVKRIIRRCRASHKLLVLDCCHAGAAFHSGFRSNQNLEEILHETTRGSASGVLAACSRSKRTRELDTLDGGAGFLSWAIAAGCTTRFGEVSPDGISLSLDDLWSWLPLALKEVNETLSEGILIPQPILWSEKEGDGQIYFTPLNQNQYRRVRYPAQSYERDFQLKAMLSDHQGFIQDRLESFVGRQAELEIIKQRISEKLQTGGYVTITGQAGQGKSSIIAKIVSEYIEDNIAHHFIPFNPGPDHQIILLRDLMARLILKHNLSDLYVASESRAALRDYFPKVLADIVERGEQEVIFVDGLDQLKEDSDGERDLSFLPNDPPKGIVFVLGTRPNDTLRPLKLLKPHNEYQLPNLSRQDFDLILKKRGVRLERGLVDEFYIAMQENALYLDLVAKELAEGEITSAPEMIKRIANNPNSIFSLAMARFKRHTNQWREVIKPILGVLLAAREPLSIQHIRQILTIEDDRLREGIERLGGLVSRDGQRRCYLFHLKLQEYLRQDENNPDKEYIFATDEEESWHKKLAEWCEMGNLSVIWQDITVNRVEQIDIPLKHLNV